MPTPNEAKLSGVAILTFFANNLCQCKLTIDGRYPTKASDSTNYTTTILIPALPPWVMKHNIEHICVLPPNEAKVSGVTTLTIFGQ